MCNIQVTVEGDKTNNRGTHKYRDGKEERVGVLLKATLAERNDT